MSCPHKLHVGPRVAINYAMDRLTSCCFPERRTRSWGLVPRVRKNLRGHLTVEAGDAPG